MTVHRWPPLVVTQLEKQLDGLVKSVQSPTDRADDDQIWLTRFLIVRACGYLEQVVHETITEHLRKRSGGTALSFALSWMTKSRTPSADNLLTAIGRLDHNLQVELESLLEADDGQLKRDLSLLVARRHQIAHGLNEGLGTRRAIELTNASKLIADWFILTLNPDRARAGSSAPSR